MTRETCHVQLETIERNEREKKKKVAKKPHCFCSPYETSSRNKKNKN